MTVHLHWPQIVYVVITFLGLVFSIRDHGKPRDANNAWHTVIALTISYGLLIMGGFFK